MLLWGITTAITSVLTTFSLANLIRLISTIAIKTRLILSVGSSLSNSAGNEPVITFTSRDFSLHPRNYDHVAGLWAHEKWLPEAAVQQARSHYAAFSVKRVDGLRVIALNTDFWYKYVAQSCEVCCVKHGRLR